MIRSIDHPSGPNRASATSVSCSIMWATSESGGTGPWCFHTTMGTPQTSQSATQQTSSSWCHSERRAASQRSQAGSKGRIMTVSLLVTQWVRMVTADPVGTVAPVGGSLPLAGLLGSPLTPATVRPAPWRVAVACAMVSPMTLGTATVGGPVETVTVTAEPNGAMAPLAGLVEMTMPEVIVVLDSGSCVAVRPTACSAAWACPNVYVWGMSGTGTGAWPCEGTIVMVDP